jgi:hypothetical protein
VGKRGKKRVKAQNPGKEVESTDPGKKKKKTKKTKKMTKKKKNKTEEKGMEEKGETERKGDESGSDSDGVWIGCLLEHEDVTASKNYTFRAGTFGEFKDFLSGMAEGRRGEGARVCTPQSLDVCTKEKASSRSQGAALRVEGLHALLAVLCTPTKNAEDEVGSDALANKVKSLLKHCEPPMSGM